MIKVSGLFIMMFSLLPFKLLWCQSVSLPVDLPVIINGQQLPRFTGRDLSNIRVFSLKNNKLSVIPFQIDQRNSQQDWVWNVTQNNSQTHDNEDPENQQVYDHNDQLVFLTGDLGQQTSLSTLAGLKASILQQVQVSTAESDSALGWVYIAYYDSNPPPLSPVHYMSYQPKPVQVNSETYQISYSEQSIAVINQLSISGHELIDRFKIRGKAEVAVLFFNSSIKFNEEEVDGYPVGYINGPVRTIKRVVNYVDLGAGMRSPSLNCDHFYYPDYVRIPILLSRSLGVKKIILRIGLDYHNVNFQYFYAQGADNIQSLKRNQGRNLLLGSNRSQWHVLSGSDYSLLSLLEVPDNILSLLRVSPYILYEPNLTDLPEKYPGMEPEAGFKITTRKEFPPGEYIVYMTNVLMNKTYKMGTGEQINQLLTKPLKVVTKPVVSGY